MSSYDTWLEQPYQDAFDESEQYISWCEDNNWDPDEPDASEAYNAWLDEEYEYDLENDEDQY